MSRLFTRPIIFWILICLLFLGLRFVNLSTVNFGSDAARDFLVVWNIYTTKHPVLIGPPSEYTVIGRQFFFGPAPYYVILPALVLGNWSFLSVSYFLIFLNLVILFISLSILYRNIQEKLIIYYFAIFCTFTPLLVIYSQSYWNPYLMLPVSTLLVALIVKSRGQKNNSFLMLLIGLLFGLGMQFHYSFIFAIIMSCIWLFLNKKITLKSLIFLGGGFVIGFFPLILFELRNHFYNLNTMLLVLTHPASVNTGFIFNSFYLVSLLPFLFYAISVFLGKINKASRLLVYIFLGAYILGSVFVILSPHRYTLSYPNAFQLAKIIELDNPKDFNVVDQLSLDNRATPVRYLLTVQGFTPMGVTDYPHAKILYIYSKQPLKILLKDPIWEIKSFLPFKTSKTLNVTDGIFLYKLKK
jgi:hypothetical protein